MGCSKVWCGGALLLTLLCPGLAEAAEVEPQAFEEEPERRLEWRYRRADVWEYSATAAVAGLYAAVEFGVPVKDEPGWTGPSLFDDGARDAFRLKSRSGRQRAADWSDATTLLTQVQVVLDGVLTPVLSDDWNFDTAWQVSFINIQAMTLTGLFARAGHRFIGRERPSVEECEKDPEYIEVCPVAKNSGFPGGHTAAAFAAASLVCAHHGAFDWYGSELADSGSCVLGLGVATASSLLRLSTDRHYLSDNIVGALLGAGIGYGLPNLLHYSHPLSVASDDGLARAGVLPLVTDSSLGLQGLGYF
ncbi:MAG: phosphatase PAP2 family protein [Polyangiaceae bacterium]